MLILSDQDNTYIFFNFAFKKLNMRALFSTYYSISFIYILEEIPGVLLFFL